MVSNMADAIIVLARGIDQNGVLQKDTVPRVEKAAKLYAKKVAPLIVMSGSWSFHLATPPARTEATAMKEHAEHLGVPAEAVLEETSSQDTIGNAYFVKKLFCEKNNWKDLVVVTSEDHLERTRYVFDKIFGAEYILTYEVGDNVLSKQEYQAQLEHEKHSLVIIKKWLDPVVPGDDAAVLELMQTKHPAYISKNDQPANN